jgi:hypothetical protein
VNVSEAGETAERPQVAIDGDGNAIAVWQRCTDGLFSARVAYKPADGPWQAPVELEPGGEVQSPQVAFDGHGNALAV